MKKIVTCLLLFLGLSVIVGCSTTTTETTQEPKEPKINLPEKNTFFTGDAFSPLDGVTATDDQGKDATSKVKAYGATDVALGLENGKFTKSGNFTIRYALEIDNTIATQVYRKIEVKFYKDPNAGLIVNGSFDTNISGWLFDKMEGGDYTSEIDNGQLKITQAALGNVSYASRFRQPEVAVEENKFYEVSFDAKAEVERSIYLQFGDMIDVSPWFFKIDKYDRFFTIKTEMQKFTYRFKAEKTDPSVRLDKGQLIFEFGKVTKGESVATTLYFDNIDMKEVDSLGTDSMGPAINYSSKNNYYVGDAFDPKEGLSISDDTDDTLTLESILVEYTTEILENGFFISEGSFTITYKATDASGNLGTNTRTITVTLRPKEDAPVLKNAEFNYVDNVFTNWNPNAQDGCSIVSSPVEKGIKMTINNANATADYFAQLVQNDIFVLDGKTYILKFTASSTVARKIGVKVQNDGAQGGDWATHIDQIFDITTEAKEYTFTFAVNNPHQFVLFALVFGKLGEDGIVAGDHDITISHLSLEIKKPVLSNPEFNEAEGVITDWVLDHAVGKIVPTKIENGIQLLLNSNGASNDFDVQLKQSGIHLETGKTYKISFSISSTIARKVGIKFQNDGFNGGSYDGDWTAHLDQVFDVTETSAVIEYEFTVTADSKDRLFCFTFGKVAGQDNITEDHTINITDLLVVEL